MWMRLQPLATTELPLEWVETVDPQAPGEEGGRYQTKATSAANWLSEDLEHDLVAHLKEGILELDGLEPLCPKLIERRDAPPWKGSRMGIFRCGTAWRGRPSW